MHILIRSAAWIALVGAALMCGTYAYASDSRWQTEISPYQCGFTNPVDGAPVARATMRLPFRGQASLTVQTTDLVPADKPYAYFALPEPASLITLGDDAEIGAATPYYSAPHAVAFSFMLDEAAFAALTRALEAGQSLAVSLPGLAQEPVPLDLRPDDMARFTSCHAALGPALMAARPEGEIPGASNRPPVMRPEGVRAMQGIQYPSRALRNNEGGDVKARLTIDIYGLPTDCMIVQSSGFAMLDQTTCREIMRRAKFYPALDQTGAATNGVAIQPMSWRTEDHRVEQSADRVTY